MWRLPGPDRLVTQVTEEVQRGRHVAVVLPSQRAAEPSFVEGLLSAIVRNLYVAGEEPRRPAPFEPGLTPLRWLARCLVFGDDLPVVVGDLLDHEDAAARTAVLDCTGPDAPAAAAVADLLTRLTLASRPRPAARRPRVVAVGTRDILPSLGVEAADVTFEAVWWWGRLTRWDVAGRLAPIADGHGGGGILRDVRLETIVEIARWDLDLAQYLVRAWDGDPHTLVATIKDGEFAAPPAPPDSAVLLAAGAGFPHGDAGRLWDDGHLELWQNEPCPSPHAQAAVPSVVEHGVWAAQSRVLLPWIEAKRQVLVRALVERFGAARVDTAAGRTPGDPAPIEVGQLFFVVRELPTADEQVWREASRRLKAARNRLAHLQILGLDDQARLIASCARLA
ncbi:hypothetical protein ACQP2P_16665 [Dactylosporangium sp. CA-139114]|uniref:hypothetical protein n=1 Tax=Dactylosporangium sp. CA-139114 TaxID=3239931 RepID=UPI003D9639A0